jgi:hypothetical protein
VAAIAQVAARAGVHGGHQHEAGREGGRVEGARDGHLAGLQGLAQHLQAAAVELGQFVEEQHAVVGHADLAGGGGAAATDHAGVADGLDILGIIHKIVV